MTSSTSSHSAARSAGGHPSAHANIAATAAPPSSRSGSRPSQLPAHATLQSLSQRSASTGSGNTARSLSLQHRNSAQPAAPGAPSGVWRESLEAGGNRSGTATATATANAPSRSVARESAGLGAAESQGYTIAGYGVDDMLASLSQHHSNAPQQAGSSAPSKPWQESVRADNAGHGSGSASGRIPPPDVLQLDLSSSRRFFRYSSPYSAIGGPLQGMRSWQVRAVKAEHNISHMTDEEAAMYLTLKKEAEAVFGTATNIDSAKAQIDQAARWAVEDLPQGP